MKKVFLFAVFAVTLGLATKAFAVSLVDVPQGHWAEDAVQKLVDLGCVEGYPDGTFKGDRPMTRYEYAMVVKRCMDVIDKKYCTVDKCSAQTAPGGKDFTPDLDELKDTLKKLAAEFKDELAALKVQVDDQGRRITDLETRMNQPMAGKLTVSGSIRQRIDVPHTDMTTTEMGLFYPAMYPGATSPGTSLKAGYEIVPTLSFNGNVKPNASLAIQISKHIANQSGVSDVSSTPTTLDINFAYVALDFTKDVKELDLLKITSGYQNLVLGPIGLLLDNSGVISNPIVKLDVAKGAVSLGVAGGIGSVTGSTINGTGLGSGAFDAIIATRLGIDLKRVVLGFNYMSSGFVSEKGWSGDFQAQILKDSPFLSAARGEYLTITNNFTGAAWPNVFGTTAAKDYSYVLDVDVYKTKRIGFTLGYADTPAVPTMSSLYSNPFLEFNNTCSIGSDYPNNSLGVVRNCFSKGLSDSTQLFPGGFKGFGLSAFYKVFGNVTLGAKAVMGDLAGGTTAAGATSTLRGAKYPGFGEFTITKPINSDTTFQIEYMQQGLNPILLNRVRGELLINF